MHLISLGKDTPRIPRRAILVGYKAKPRKNVDKVKGRTYVLVDKTFKKSARVIFARFFAAFKPKGDLLVHIMRADKKKGKFTVLSTRRVPARKMRKGVNTVSI